MEKLCIVFRFWMDVGYSDFNIIEELSLIGCSCNRKIIHEPR